MRLARRQWFTPMFAAATVAFSFWAARAEDGASLGPGVLITLTVLCGLLTVTAAVNLVVARRRSET